MWSLVHLVLDVPVRILIERGADVHVDVVLSRIKLLVFYVLDQSMVEREGAHLVAFSVHLIILFAVHILLLVLRLIALQEKLLMIKGVRLRRWLLYEGRIRVAVRRLLLPLFVRLRDYLVDIQERA